MLCTWALRFLFGWNTLIECTGNLGTCMKYKCEFRSTGIPTFVFLVVICEYIWNIKYLFVLLVGLLCCNPDSSMDLLYLFCYIQRLVRQCQQQSHHYKNMVWEWRRSLPHHKVRVPKWHTRSIPINRWNVYCEVFWCIPSL